MDAVHFLYLFRGELIDLNIGRNWDHAHAEQVPQAG